jgi:nitrogen regulatory protein P-II 1
LKLVIAIVRPEKANDVLEALYRTEVRGVSISHVEGHGGELDRVETYRGTTVKIGLSDKVRFEIAVSDSFVQRTIKAIREGAQTGEVGDGKIFVLPLEQAVRIRTGEKDKSAVTPVGKSATRARKPATRARKPATRARKPATRARKPGTKAAR